MYPEDPEFIDWRQSLAHAIFEVLAILSLDCYIIELQLQKSPGQLMLLFKPNTILLLIELR
jgi:hypothetical protein